MGVESTLKKKKNRIQSETHCLELLNKEALGSSLVEKVDKHIPLAT